jgi:hypothetical protein
MEAAEGHEVASCFARLSAVADLDEIEHEELRQLAKERSGVGLRVINAMLKAAQQQQATLITQAAQAHRAAVRQDPRPLIRSPFPDDPWLPQMKVVNEVISAVTTIAPPVRNIDDDATRVRKRPVADMHAFTNANEPEGDDE